MKEIQVYLCILRRKLNGRLYMESANNCILFCLWQLFQIYRKLERWIESITKESYSISISVLFSSLVFYLCTCATNFLSTWILPTFHCSLKEIAHTLWHELAPDWLILLYPREFMYQVVPGFSHPLLFFSLFPLAPLPRAGFLPELVLVTHLSVSHQAFALSDRQVLAMSDGVICHKCTKHDWSEKCHPREVHFHSSQILTHGPTSHFPSFYTSFCVLQADLSSTGCQSLPPLQKTTCTF